MTVAASAAVVAAAVPLIALLVSPAPSSPTGSQSAVWADTTDGNSFSVLQRRARSVEARVSPGEGFLQEELALLQENLRENLTEAQVLGPLRHRNCLSILQRCFIAVHAARPGVCFDKYPRCAELAARWANCMDYDLTQQPPPAPRVLQPVEFLRQNCRKTCAYCGNNLALQQYYLREIKNDEVDKELSYAKTGSAIPDSMHGVFWLDQWGSYPEGTGCDPSFQYSFEALAVNELLATFGDGLEWDPEGRCIVGSPWSGRQGHWTYTNQGAEKAGNQVWAFFNYPFRLSAHFCFTSDNEIDIRLVLVPALPLLMQPFFRLLLGPPDSRGFFSVPSILTSSTIKLSCFGWHRTTRVGPRLLAKALGMEFNYAAFQIVDGNGQKTKHWPAYLRWANSKGTNCNGITDGPCNLGDGTQVSPQWVIPNAEITPQSPFYTGAMPWLRTFNP